MVTKLSLLQKRNPMNTETQPTPTAAELLAEWKRLQLIDPDYGHLPNGEAHLQNSIDDMLMTNIAAQLDKMCEDIEMNHSDGSVHILQCGLNWWQNPDNIDDDDIAEIEIKKFEAQRMQNLIALLQWLLIKAQ